MLEAPRGHRGPRRRPERLRESLVRRGRGVRGCVLTAAIPRILGVDPGTRCAGWAVVGGSTYEPELIACGEIRLPERLALANRLAQLYAELTSIVSTHAPSEAAVEAPFHGASARSALLLAHARGVVLAALGAARVPVFEYAPAAIKKAVTGTGQADKQQIEAMVGRLIRGGPPPGRSDVADAIAAGLCHLFAAPVRDLRERIVMPASRAGHR